MHLHPKRMDKVWMRPLELRSGNNTKIRAGESI